MTVSILTATIPDRESMLAEARASVAALDGDVEHLVGIDGDRQGAGPVLNRLLSVATGEWVMVLDDDDLLDPDHLATVLPHVHQADVLYTLPRVEGGDFTQYHEPFSGAALERGHNCVSHTALMRTDLVRDVGGWSVLRWFDLDLFRRLHRAGASFLQIPTVTWTYRLHGANWSHGTLEGAR